MLPFIMATAEKAWLKLIGKLNVAGVALLVTPHCLLTNSESHKGACFLVRTIPSEAIGGYSTDFIGITPFINCTAFCNTNCSKTRAVK